MSTSDIVAELKAIPVGKLATPVEIIECFADTRLKDVVTLLLKNNISSCPVRKTEYKDKPDAEFSEAYLGLIDILDIVAFVIEMNKTVGKWGPGFEAVLETLVQFSEHVVSDVMNSGPNIAFQSVPSSASVHDCLVILGKDRFHRVVVLDTETRRMTQIITQSSMARFLASLVSSSSTLSSFASKSLAELNLGKVQRVISLNTNAKAVDAFNVIQRNRVTGVPVVNASGVIVGNLSARDIRSLVGSPDKFDRLFDNLSEFLEGIKADRNATTMTSTSPRSTATPSLSSGVFGGSEVTTVASVAPSTTATTPEDWHVPGAYTVDASDSLVSALQLLVSKNIHRAYLVDEGRHPTGVLSLTDIMRVFAEGKGDDSKEVRRGSLYKEYVPTN